MECDSFPWADFHSIGEVVVAEAATSGRGGRDGDCCGGGEDGGGIRNIILGLELIRCFPKPECYFFVF